METLDRVRVMRRKEGKTDSRPAPGHKFIGASGRALDRIEGMFLEAGPSEQQRDNSSSIRG